DGLRLDLEPLDRDAVRQLAEAALDGPVGSDAADRLLDHTGGNPLHLRTLLEELPAGAPDPPGPLPLPRAYSNLVLARLAETSPAVEALVLAVAILGDPAPVAAVAGVAELDDPGPALDEAVAHGFVTTNLDPEGGLSVSMGHPLVRDAVLEDVP